MWYKSKIKFYLRNDDKNRTEEFLHKADSFTDVEAQLNEILHPRVKDFEIEAISKASLADVYEPLREGQYFFEVTIEFDEVDKKWKARNLVIAEDDVQAGQFAREFHKDSMLDWQIVAIKQTRFLGVWHPHNSEWQSDFRNRMEDLEAQGLSSDNNRPTKVPDEIDSNQLDLFDSKEEPELQELP